MSMTSMKLSTTATNTDQLTQSPYQTPDTVAVKVYLEIAENPATNHYKSILVGRFESSVF